MPEVIYLNLGELIDEVTETVQHEIIKKNKKADFLELCAPLAASLAPPVISSVVKGISGRGIRRAGRRYMNTNF